MWGVLGVCLFVGAFPHKENALCLWAHVSDPCIESLGRIIKTPRWLSVGTPGAHWDVIKEERRGYVL